MESGASAPQSSRRTASPTSCMMCRVREPAARSGCRTPHPGGLRKKPIRWIGRFLRIRAKVPGIDALMLTTHRYACARGQQARNDSVRLFTRALLSRVQRRHFAWPGVLSVRRPSRSAGRRAHPGRPPRRPRQRQSNPRDSPSARLIMRFCRASGVGGASATRRLATSADGNWSNGHTGPITRPFVCPTPTSEKAALVAAREAE